MSSSTFLHRRMGAAAALAFFHLETEIVLGANLLRDIFVNGLVDIGEHAHFHQVGDDLKGLAFQLLRQVAHNDGRFQRDHFAGGGRNKFFRLAWLAPERRPVFAPASAPALWPGNGWAAGAVGPPRTARISPRRAKSVLPPPALAAGATGFLGRRAGAPAWPATRQNPPFHRSWAPGGRQAVVAAGGGLSGPAAAAVQLDRRAGAPARLGLTAAGGGPTASGAGAGAAAAIRWSQAAQRFRRAAGQLPGSGRLARHRIIGDRRRRGRRGAGGDGWSAAAGAGACGCSLTSSSSRYSAVILSSELDGTLAAVMPNSLALASTSLLSMPSFFAKS